MAAATTKQKQLTPVQRAAAVVIALGADRASEVYRYLKDDEVEQISLEIAKLNRLSPEHHRGFLWTLRHPEGHHRRRCPLCQGRSGKGLWPGTGLLVYGSPVQIPADPFL